MWEVHSNEAAMQLAQAHLLSPAADQPRASCLPRTSMECGTTMEQLLASEVVGARGRDTTPPNRTSPPRDSPVSTDTLMYWVAWDAPKFSPNSRNGVPPRVSANESLVEAKVTEGGLVDDSKREPTDRNGVNDTQHKQ